MALLRFGIPSLDALLLGGATDTDNRNEKSTSTTVCIIGADGTGKTVLALHLASTYAADQEDPWSAIYYVGTDVTAKTARDVWKRFKLNTPNGREHDPVRVTIVTERDYGEISVHFNRKVDILGQVQEPTSPEVRFVDLAAGSPGDAWQAIARLIATLPPRKSDERPHLLIIDSVDGCRLNFDNIRSRHLETCWCGVCENFVHHPRRHE
jgi:hypothetical protein